MNVPFARRPLALLGLLLAASACGEPTRPDPTGTVPAAIQFFEGNRQSGVVATELAGELAFRVVDGKARPVPGMALQVTLPDGGTVTPAESTVPGVIRVRWTLGSRAGGQELRVRLDGYDVAPVTVTATARPDVPATVARVSGEHGAGPVGATLEAALRVRVADRWGNLVEGAAVAWEAVAGGGSLSPARDSTDAAGVATAQWTLGPRADSVHRARATVAGIAPVEFTATAVTAGATLMLAKRGGDEQQAMVGTVLADSLAVVLRMPDGRPVPGAQVSWAAQAGSGLVTPSSTRTDAQGRASAVWRLGTVAGPVQATARVDGGTLVFTAGARHALPASVAIAGGDGATGPIGNPLPTPLAVRVADTYGNPVPDWEVIWSAAGGGTLPHASLTDAQGVARATWILGPRMDPAQTATASVAGLQPAVLSATGVTAGSRARIAVVAGDSQRAAVGSVLADSLVALVHLDFRPVRGALVTWTVVYGNGSVSPVQSRTDAAGRAYAAWRMGPQITAAQAAATLDGQSVSFFANPQAGAPARLHLAHGGGSPAGVGQPLPDSLQVVVMDANGNMVRGATVSWAAAPGSGSVSPAQSVTDVYGIARTRWTLGLVADSAQRAVATVAGVGSVDIHATTGTRGVELQLARVAGEGQTGTAGAVLADSLEVEVRTAAGQPVRNALVRWEVLTGGSISPLSVRTDARGRARAAWRLSTQGGPGRARAIVDDTAVTFSATGTP